jgi:hypothetical protein
VIQRGAHEYVESNLIRNQIRGIRFELLVADIIDEIFPEATIKLTRHNEHMDMSLNFKGGGSYLIECKRFNLYRKHYKRKVGQMGVQMGKVMIKKSQYEGVIRHLKKRRKCSLFYVFGCELPNGYILMTICPGDTVAELLKTAGNKQGKLIQAYMPLGFQMLHEWLEEVKLRRFLEAGGEEIER